MKKHLSEQKSAPSSSGSRKGSKESLGSCKGSLMTHYSRRLLSKRTRAKKQIVPKMMSVKFSHRSFATRRCLCRHRPSYRAVRFAKRPTALYSYFRSQPRNFRIPHAEQETEDSGFSGEWPMNWSLASYEVRL